MSFKPTQLNSNPSISAEEKAFLEDFSRKNRALAHRPTAPTKSVGATGLYDSKYDRAVAPGDYEHINTFRARNQPWHHQAGAAIAQSTAEIVGGVVEGVGYLGEIPKDIGNLKNRLKGVDIAAESSDRFGNWVAQLGMAIKEHTREALPIYQEAPGTWNPGDSGWWFAHAPSVASTLSLAIPSMGVVKGLSYGAKLMKVSEKLQKMGMSAKSIESLGKGATILGQAAISRQMESNMEAAGIYQETLEMLKKEGITGDKARQIASEAAAQNYRRNWAMLSQDILQFSLLGTKLDLGAMDDAFKVASAQGKKASWLANQGLDLAKAVVSEGGEEAYQFIIGEEAKYLGQMKAGLTEKTAFGQRMSEYAKSGEMWTSAFWGAIGGGIFQSAVSPIKDAMDKDRQAAIDDQVQLIKDTPKNIAYWAKTLQEAKASGNPTILKDAQLRYNHDMTLNTAERGQINFHIETLKQLQKLKDPEALAAYNEGKPEEEQINESAIEHIDEMISDAKLIREKYENASKKYAAGTYRQIARSDFLIDKYQQRIDEVTEQAEQFKTLEGAKFLDEHNKQIFDLKHEISGLKLAKKKMQYWAKSDRVPEDMAKNYADKIPQIDAEVKAKNKQISELNKAQQKALKQLKESDDPNAGIVKEYHLREDAALMEAAGEMGQLSEAHSIKAMYEAELKKEKKNNATYKSQKYQMSDSRIEKMNMIINNIDSMEDVTKMAHQLKAQQPDLFDDVRSILVKRYEALSGLHKEERKRAATPEIAKMRMKRLRDANQLKAERQANAQTVEAKLLDDLIEQEEIDAKLTEAEKELAISENLLRKANKPITETINGLKTIIEEHQALIDAYTNRTADVRQAEEIVAAAKEALKRETAMLKQLTERVIAARKAITTLQPLQAQMAEKIKYYEQLLKDDTLETLSKQELQEREAQLKESHSAITKVIKALKKAIQAMVNSMKTLVNNVLKNERLFKNTLAENQSKEAAIIQLQTKLKDIKDVDWFTAVKISELEELIKEVTESDEAANEAVNKAIDDVETAEKIIKQKQDHAYKLQQQADRIQRELGYLSELIGFFNIEEAKQREANETTQTDETQEREVQTTQPPEGPKAPETNGEETEVPNEDADLMQAMRDYEEEIATGKKLDNILGLASFWSPRNKDYNTRLASFTNEDERKEFIDGVNAHKKLWGYLESLNRTKEDIPVDMSIDAAMFDTLIAKAEEDTNKELAKAYTKLKAFVLDGDTSITEQEIQEAFTKGLRYDGNFDIPLDSDYVFTDIYGQIPVRVEVAGDPNMITHLHDSAFTYAVENTLNGTVDKFVGDKAAASAQMNKFKKNLVTVLKDKHAQRIKQAKEGEEVKWENTYMRSEINKQHPGYMSFSGEFENLFTRVTNTDLYQTVIYRKTDKGEGQYQYANGKPVESKPNYKTFKDPVPGQVYLFLKAPNGETVAIRPQVRNLNPEEAEAIFSAYVLINVAGNNVKITKDTKMEDFDLTKQFEHTQVKEGDEKAKLVTETENTVKKALDYMKKNFDNLTANEVLDLLTFRHSTPEKADPEKVSNLFMGEYKGKYGLYFGNESDAIRSNEQLPFVVSMARRKTEFTDWLVANKRRQVHIKGLTKRFMNLTSAATRFTFMGNNYDNQSRYEDMLNVDSVLMTNVDTHIIQRGQESEQIIFVQPTTFIAEPSFKTSYENMTNVDDDFFNAIAPAKSDEDKPSGPNTAMPGKSVIGPEEDFRATTKDEVEFDSQEEEIAHIAKILPQLPIKLQKRVHSMAGDKEAFGKFVTAMEIMDDFDKAYGVYLSELQPKNKKLKGTVYHEAYHAVEALYLTPTEISELDKESKRIYPAPTEKQIKEFGSAEKYYEEKRAEDFRVYAKSRTGFVGALRTWFDTLVNLINSFMGNKSAIRTLFTNINRGKYKNAKANSIRVPSESLRQIGKVPLDQTALWVNSLTAAVVRKYDVLNKGQKIPRNEITSAALTREVLASRLYLYRTQTQDMSATPKEHPNDWVRKNLPEAYFMQEEVLNNIDTFTELVKDNLQRNFSDAFAEEQSSILEEDADTGTGELIAKSAYEYDPKKKAKDMVKLTVASLVKMTKDGAAIIHPKTGMPQLANFDATWSLLTKKLANVVDTRKDNYSDKDWDTETAFAKMKGIVAEQAQWKPELQVLSDIISHPDFDANQQAQFLSAFSLTFYDFVNMYIERIPGKNMTKEERAENPGKYRHSDDFTYHPGDPKSKTKEDTILNEWTENFKLKAGAQNKKAKTETVNVQDVDNLITRRTNLANSVNQAIDTHDKTADVNKNEAQLYAKQQAISTLMKQTVILLQDSGVKLGFTPVESLNILKYHLQTHPSIKEIKGELDKLSVFLENISHAYNDTLNPVSLTSLKNKQEAVEKEYADKKIKEGNVKARQLLDSNGVVPSPWKSEKHIRALAESAATFRDDLNDNTIVGPGANTYWVYSQFNEMYQMVNQFIENPEYLESITSRAYHKRSLFADQILNGDVEPRVRVFNAMVERNASDTGDKIADLSAQEELAMYIHYVLNEKNLADGESRKSLVPTMARADKGVYQFLEGFKLYENDIKFNVKDGSIILTNSGSSETITIFMRYLLDELDRIKIIQEQVKDLTPAEKIEFLHTEKRDKDGNILQLNGMNSSMFPLLSARNPDAEAIQYYDAEIQAQYEALSDDERARIDTLHEFLYDPTTGKANNVGLYENDIVNDGRLRRYVGENLVKAAQADLEDAVDKQIIEEENGIYINKVISPPLVKYYTKAANDNQSEGIEKLMADYTLNTLIANIEATKLFFGDPTAYKSLEDLTKRTPEISATGQRPMLLKPEKGEKGGLGLTYTAAVGKDIERPSDTYTTEYRDNVLIPLIKADRERIKAIKPDVKFPNSIEDAANKLIAPYQNVVVTDAQAYITLDRWRAIHKMLGRWDQKYEDTYQRALKGEETVEDVKRISLQPLKGVYYELSPEIQQQLNIPVYLKYSQAVLYPGIAKTGTGLGDLYKAMTDQGVDEVIFESGVKAGAKGKVNINQPNFEFSKMTLHNWSWKLQLETPTKGDKNTKEGTQMRKNIIANILKDVQYGDLTGRQIVQELNTVNTTLSDIAAQEFFAEIGWDGETVHNLDKLYDMLVEEFKDRDASQNIIDALTAEEGTDRADLDAIPQAKEKIQSVLMSMIKKRTVQLTMPGGSYVQMSNAMTHRVRNKTLEELQEEIGNIGNGILYLKDPNDMSPSRMVEDKDGPIEINGTKYKFHGGDIFLPHSIIGKIPNAYQLIKTEAGRKELLKIIEESGMLSAIGYRIPNQGLASTDSLNVAGFLPREMGDTVIAYSEITAKMGSDFDIDKMYIMFPHFNRKTLKKIEYYREPTDKQDEELYFHWIKQQWKTRQDLRADYDKMLSAKNKKEYFKKQLKEAEAKFLEERKDAYSAVLVNELFTGIIENVGNRAALLESLSDDARVAMDEADIAIGEIEDEIFYAKAEEDGIIKKVKNTPGYRLEDFKQLPVEQKHTKEALENRKFELYNQILQAPETHLRLIQALDVEDMKRDIKEILFPDKPFEALEYFSQRNQTKKKRNNINGSKGISTAANTEVDIALLQHAEVSLNMDLGVGNKTAEGMTDFSNPYDENGNLITINIDAFLNAFVDIAKDDYIARGNYNGDTVNVAYILLKAGADPMWVNRFIGQPILKDYVRFKDNLAGRLAEKDKGALKATEEKYGIEINTLVDSKTSFADIMAEVRSKKDILEKAITEGRDLGPDMQAKILYLFKTLNELGQEDFDQIRASKADTTGGGKSLMSAWTKEEIVRKVLKLTPDEFQEFNKMLRGESFDATLLNKNTQFKNFYRKFHNTQLGAFYKNSVKLSQEVFGSLFISATPVTKMVVQEVAAQQGMDYVTDEDFATMIGNEVYSYVISKTEGLFNLTPEQMHDLFINKENHKGIALRFLEATEKSDVSNGVLRSTILHRMLTTSGAYNENEPSWVQANNIMKPSVESTNELYQTIEAMLDNPETKDLMLDLIHMAAYSSGFNFNMNSFYDVIPASYLEDIGFSKRVKRIRTWMADPANAIQMAPFFDQVYKNNYNNQRLVPRMRQKDVRPIDSQTKTNDPKFSSSAIMVSHSTKNPSPYYIGHDNNGNPIWKPYLSHQYSKDPESEDPTKITILYKLLGVNPDKNTAVYVRTHKLGYSEKGKKIVEYRAGENLDKSFYEENNKFIVDSKGQNWIMQKFNLVDPVIPKANTGSIAPIQTRPGLSNKNVKTKDC